MVEHLVRVGNVFYVQQLHHRIALRVEVYVHILQYRLNAYLVAIAHTPDTVELQALADGTLKDKHSRSTTARDEVDAFGVELGNRFGEHRVVPAGEQADAIGTNERTAILLTDVEYALLQFGPLVGFLTEAGRNNNERANMLFGCQKLYVVRTILGSNDEDGQVRRRQFAGVVKCLDALHLVLLGVHDTKRTTIAAAKKIAYNGTAGLMNIITTADDDDTLWL